MASGVENLWGIENVSGLVRPHRAAPGQRFDAEIGYGLGSRVLWYPYVAGDSTGQRRFGLNLSSGRTLGASVVSQPVRCLKYGYEDARAFWLSARRDDL